MDRPADAHHPPATTEGADPAPTADAPAEVAGREWSRFQDRLESAIASLTDGAHLDLADADGDGGWRIRLRAGWPGVEGPGTFAYHLQIGADRITPDTIEVLGPWADTPLAQSFGFAATRAAGEITALGLASHPRGKGNPGLVTAGPVGILEMADTALELVHTALDVARPGDLCVEGHDARSVATRPAARDTRDPVPAAWWAAHGFVSEPWCHPGGRHLVGWIDDVLVDVEHDTTSLPGLSVAVVRARLTDPSAPACSVPPGGAASGERLRPAQGCQMAVEAVRAGDGLVHLWAHRMVVGGDQEHVRADGPGGTDLHGVREAVADAVRFVSRVRRVDPGAQRPARMVVRPIP